MWENQQGHRFLHFLIMTRIPLRNARNAAFYLSCHCLTKYTCRSHQYTKGYMTSLAWVNDQGISTRYIKQVHEGARSATLTLQWFYPFEKGEGGYCFGVVLTGIV